jgi:hypothetical protein
VGARRALLTGPDPPGFEPAELLSGVPPLVPALVRLSVLLAGPGPSGGAGSSRRCRAASRPPRRLPGQAAPSFTGLLRQPGGGALSFPPGLMAPRGAPAQPSTGAPKPGRRLDLPPSDPRLDPRLPQVGTVGSAVIALIGVNLGGSGAAPPRRRADRRDVGQQRCEHGGIGEVAAVTTAASGSPPPSQTRCSLLPGLPRSTGFAPTHGPPRLAPTLMVPTLARDQSSRPCAPNRSRISRRSWSNTPALAHSVRRRQQVDGEPQPSSWTGSSRQGVEARAM